MLLKKGKKIIYMSVFDNTKRQEDKMLNPALSELGVNSKSEEYIVFRKYVFSLYTNFPGKNPGVG